MHPFHRRPAYRFAILLTIAVSFVFHASASAQDPRAILNDARNKINAFKDVTVEFTKSLRFPEGNQAAAIAGKLIFKKGNKFIVHIKGQDIYCNGQTMWRISHDDEEITISDYDRGEGLSPDRIFNISQDQMRAQYSGAETINGMACHKIMLYPTQTTDYVSITVWVDKAKHLPRQTMTHNKNGSRITYTITSIVSDKGIEDAVFSLDTGRFPAGYRVEDIR